MGDGWPGAGAGLSSETCRGGRAQSPERDEVSGGRPGGQRAAGGGLLRYGSGWYGGPNVAGLWWNDIQLPACEVEDESKIKSIEMGCER